jgi:DNA-binding LacI/PurR family transcriptional regulator
MTPPKHIGLRQPTKRQSIKETVKRWIADQKLAPGDRIRSQNELARILGTTPVTVFKALTELSNEGVVHRVTGKGTFVGPASDGSGRAHTREICLVLPGPGLERPEANPLYWPYVQTMLHAFTEVASDRWVFSVRAVRPETDPHAVAGQFRRYGAVFFYHTKEPAGLLRHLIREKIAPVVAFGQPRHEFPCLTIEHDRIEGARLGTRHLIGLGHRNIAFLGSTEYWGEMSLEGYVKALADAGRTVDNRLVVRVAERHEDAVAGVARLLKRGRPFDAVVVDSDIRGLGVLEGLRQAGVAVPEAVSVLGYDGLDYANRQPPYLTSVDIPLARMIATALGIVEKNGWGPTPQQFVSIVGDVLPGRTVQGREAAAAPASS